MDNAIELVSTITDYYECYQTTEYVRTINSHRNVWVITVGKTLIEYNSFRTFEVLLLEQKFKHISL